MEKDLPMEMESPDQLTLPFFSWRDMIQERIQQITTLNDKIVRAPMGWIRGTAVVPLHNPNYHTYPLGQVVIVTVSRTGTIALDREDGGNILELFASGLTFGASQPDQLKHGNHLPSKKFEVIRSATSKEINQFCQKLNPKDPNLSNLVGSLPINLGLYLSDLRRDNPHADEQYLTDYPPRSIRPKSADVILQLISKYCV